MFAGVIGRGLCSLREIQEVYSFNDVLDLAEIICVENANQTLIDEYIRKQNQR